MKIGEKTLKELADLAEGALLTHINGINTGFRNAGERDFKIGLKGTINSGAGDGDFKLKIDIDYVIEKTSDSFSRQVHEKQTSLPLDEPTKVCPKRDDGAEIFISVCAKCKDRESVILIDGETMPLWIGHKEPLPKKDLQMVQYMSCKAWDDDDYCTFCDEMLRKAIVYEASVKQKQEEKPKLKKIAGGKA